MHLGGTRHRRAPTAVGFCFASPTWNVLGIELIALPGIANSSTGTSAIDNIKNMDEYGMRARFPVERRKPANKMFLC